MGTKFDRVIESGGQAMDHMDEASKNLSKLANDMAGVVSGIRSEIEEFSKSATGSLDKTVALLLNDFKESIGRMQDSLAVSKSLLVESIAGVTPALRGFVEPTIAELRQSSLDFIGTAETLRVTLESIPELIAGRIENLAQPSVAAMSSAIDSTINRLTTVFEPATIQFVQSIKMAQDSVQEVTGKVTSEMNRLVKDAVSDFDAVANTHQGTIQRTESVVDRMEQLLNNSEGFTDLVSSVERNLALTIEIDKLLLSKKQPFYSRLDVALVGALIGFFVGRAVLDESDQLIIVVLLPAFVATLSGDPWVTSLFKHLETRKKKS